MKQATRSQELSHLIAQTITAVDSLTHDAEARRTFADEVYRRSGTHIDAGFAPTDVMLAIRWSGGRPLTASSMQVFAQINLLHAVHSLPGINLTVTAIS